MSTATIGTLAISVIARTEKFFKGMTKAERKMAVFSSRMRKSSIAMGAISAGLLTPLALATREAINFEAQMAKVSTMLSGLTDKYLPEMTVEIQHLSRAMGQGTVTLTDSLYDILSGQIDAAQSTYVLQAATKAAVAGMTDTKTATLAMVSVLNSFRLSADQAADVSDLLFSIIWRGRGQLEDFAPAIGMVASSSALAGISMEEMGAALTTMTRVGVPITRATTALRSLLQIFLKPTEAAAQAAEQLGIILNTATLRSEGMVGVIRKLVRGNAELTAHIIPNRRALLGLAAIIQNVEGYYKDINLMTNRTGRTQAAFAKVSGSTKFMLGRLAQSAVALARTLGQLLLPTIKDATKALLSIVEPLLGLAKLMPGVTRAILLTVAAIGVLTGALAALTVALWSITAHPIIAFFLGLGGAIGGIAALLISLLTPAVDKLDGKLTATGDSLNDVATESEQLTTAIQDQARAIDELLSGFDGLADGIANTEGKLKSLRGTPVGGGGMMAWESRQELSDYIGELDKHIAQMEQTVAAYRRMAKQTGLDVWRQSADALFQSLQEVDREAFYLRQLLGELPDVPEIPEVEESTVRATELVRPGALELGTAAAYSAAIAGPQYRGFERSMRDMVKEEEKTNDTLNQMPERIGASVADHLNVATL